MKYFHFVGLFLTLSLASFAQNLSTTPETKAIVTGIEKETPPAEDVVQPKEQKKKFEYSGYFDTYYFFNLNAPSSRTNLGNSGVARGFDRYPGQFQLGMFLNRMRYEYKNTEVVGEIGFGPNMEYGSYGNDFRYKWGNVVANQTYTAIMIKQAYITYKASQKLSFIMGQFGTHIGFEYIDAPLNFHYSINNTFNSGIPFYHVGLKAQYVVSEKISLMAGVVNGTDNINDDNRAKSFIAQVAYQPKKNLSIYFNTIQGNEANAKANGKNAPGYFGVFDVCINYQVTDKLFLGGWFMEGLAEYEFQGTSFGDNAMKHWSGVNVYAQYKVSPICTIGTRIEYFDNRNGARALRTNGQGVYVDTYTFTANIHLADGQLILKPEFRADVFQKLSSNFNEENIQQFEDKDGNFTKNSQSTVGLAAVYKF